jgi:hypothetical protein
MTAPATLESIQELLNGLTARFDASDTAAARMQTEMRASTADILLRIESIMIKGQKSKKKINKIDKSPDVDSTAIKVYPNTMYWFAKTYPNPDLSGFYDDAKVAAALESIKDIESIPENVKHEKVGFALWRLIDKDIRKTTLKTAFTTWKNEQAKLNTETIDKDATP